VPSTREGLDAEAWKAAVKRAKETIAAQQQLLETDRGAVAALRAATAKLSGEGRHWAKSITGRLKARCLYLESMIALNRSLVTFDETARQQGLEAGRKAADEHARRSLDLARRAVEKCSGDVRSRFDRDAVAQLESQLNGTIRQWLTIFDDVDDDLPDDAAGGAADQAQGGTDRAE